MDLERVAYDCASLDGPSRFFAERLFRRLPQLEEHAYMVRRPSGELSLGASLASPTGDPDRALGIWMNEGVEPSVTFGWWHTHAGLEVADPDDETDPAAQADCIIALVEGILADLVVQVSPVEKQHKPGWEYGYAVDLREPDLWRAALLREYPGRVRVATWSGKGDRETDISRLAGGFRKPGGSRF